jgi:hypothetical protein
VTDKGNRDWSREIKSRGPDARGLDAAELRAMLLREMDQINEDIADMRRRIDNMSVIVNDAQVRLAVVEGVDVVSKHEFEPVKRLVWGFTGTVLLAVLIAVLALVVTKGVPIRP